MTETNVLVRVLRAATALAILLSAGCASTVTPAPPVGATTANAYILPGGVALGANAFGDEPIVIYTGETMRWQNLDEVEHTVVADTMALPEFATTGRLAPAGERSFVMHTVGTTRIHCAEHPQMVGTLIVRSR